MGCVRAVVSDAVIDQAEHFALVENAAAGAIASFVGTIRNHDPEARGEVTGIEYCHHPDAQQILGQIVADVLAELDPLDEAKVAVTHRVGRLMVDDLALVCCVATAHRAEAFQICEQIVEQIKQRLPIWKEQFEADGRKVWSQLGLGEGS